MKSNKRNLFVIIIILVILILLAIGGFVFMYATTDFLKSDEQLFQKYFAQNLESLGKIFDTTQVEQIDREIKNNNHESSTVIKVGTKNENSEDYIELASATIDTVKDNASEKKQKYSDINLIVGDFSAELEYMSEKDKLSVRPTDLVLQYLTIENKDLKTLATNLGMSETDVESIPDTIDFDEISSEQFAFSDEEISTLKQKYLQIFSENISKEHYSRQKNAMITINSNTITTDAFILRMTEQEFKNVVIKILEELKQDEIILAKLEKIDSLSNSDESSETSIKMNFVEMIQSIIDDLNEEEASEEEIKITINVQDGKTVRIKIEENMNSLTLDTIQTDELIAADLKIISIDSDTEYSSTISLSRKLNNNFNLSIEMKNVIDEEENTSNASIEIGKDSNNNIIRNFETTTENMQIRFKNNIIITDHIEFDDIEEIVLNDLNSERLTSIMNAIAEEAEKTYNLEGALADLLLPTIYNSATDVVENTDLSDTAKTAFNSKFETYEGTISGTNLKVLVATVLNNNINESNSKVSISGAINLSEEATESPDLTTIDTSKTYLVKCSYDEAGFINKIEVTKND